MKLEIKHLAPYQPYDLKFYIPNDEHELIQEMTGLSKCDGIQTDYTTEDSTGCRGNLWSFDGERNYKHYGVKPILRPLSDLAKEIDFNGNKVTPIKELLKANCFNVESMSEDDIMKYREALLLDLSYAHAQILLSMHFDLFGLISQGLAIDINTLK